MGKPDSGGTAMLAGEMRIAAEERKPGTGVLRALCAGIAMLLAAFASGAARGDDDRFRRFIEDLWPKAQARDVSLAMFDAAFKGVTLDPKIAKLPDQQAEFVRPIWDYLASAIDAKRIKDGQAKAKQWSDVLARA